MKVTGEGHAYIGQYCTLTPQDLQEGKGLCELSFFSTKAEGREERGYTYIGPATVTVEVPDLRGLVDSKVEALRKQAVAIRAKATAECTEIESQIQNLLAIEYTPTDD
jgi:hypothetical protein